MKLKTTTHRYPDWRSRILDHHLSTILTRLEQRVVRDGDQAVLTDDQRLVVFLRDMLDEGGEVTEEIYDIVGAWAQC